MFSDDNRIQLEIDNKASRKTSSIWKLKNIFLINTCLKKKIIRETRKYFILNNHENKIYQYLWDAAKKV